jgi:hypothetical protein
MEKWAFFVGLLLISTIEPRSLWRPRHLTLFKEGALPEMNKLFETNIPNFVPIEGDRFKKWNSFATFPWKHLDEPKYLKVRDTARTIMMNSLATLMDSWTDQDFIMGRNCPKFQPVKSSRPSNITIATVYQFKSLQKTFTKIFMHWYKSVSVEIRSGKTKDDLDPKDIQQFVQGMREVQASLKTFDVQFKQFQQHWDKEIGETRCLFRDWLNFYRKLDRFVYVYKKIPPSPQTMLRYSKIPDKLNSYRKSLVAIDKSVQIFMFFYCIFRETISFGSGMNTIEIDDNASLLLTHAMVNIKMTDKISYNINKASSLWTKAQKDFSALEKKLRPLEIKAKLFTKSPTLKQLSEEFKGNSGGLIWGVLISLVVSTLFF